MAIVPSSNSGAAAAHSADWSGPVAAVGLSRRHPRLRSHVAAGSSVGAGGGRRSGVTASGRGRRWRSRAASRVIQHAVPPSRGPSCGLNPRTGSRGTFAVNGWRVPRVDVSGCSTAGVVQRRSAGCSRVVALSGARLGHGPFERPVQHASGAVAPDRLVRSCHRGARLICNV